MTEIVSKSRKTGLTLAQCMAMLPALKDGKTVFVATNKYPENIINILLNLGVEVNAEEQWSQPNLEAIYGFDCIIDFIQPEKKLIGYILKNNGKRISEKYEHQTDKDK